MKYYSLLFLCLFLILFTSCTKNQSENISPQPNLNISKFEINISTDDLSQLYLDNAEEFDNVISEFEKIPEEVYTVSLENEGLSLFNGDGEKVSIGAELNYYAFSNCYKILQKFADRKIQTEYRIIFHKIDNGFSLTIRQFDVQMDYSLIYNNGLNYDGMGALVSIEGPWYAQVVGLV